MASNGTLVVLFYFLPCSLDMEDLEAPVLLGGCCEQNGAEWLLEWQ